MKGLGPPSLGSSVLSLRLTPNPSTGKARLAQVWSEHLQYSLVKKLQPADFFFSFFLFSSLFLGLHLRHTEVPRVGVKLELQLSAYATATATWDPILICYLHLSSRQHRIFNPLHEARDQTHILMDTSQVHYH